MDQYVKNKLKEWKLERFIGIFRENAISKKNFHSLTNDAIAGLVPTVGSRTTFLKNFEQLKMEKKNESGIAQDTASSHSEISDAVDDSCIDEPAVYKKDIRALLSKNRAGRQILNTLNSGKPPTNFLKKKLAVFLYDDLMQSHGPNPSAQLKVELAKAILKEFPHLYMKNIHTVPLEELMSAEHQKESSENSSIKQQEINSSALEYYTDMSRKISKIIADMNIDSENNLLQSQDENCVTKQSGSLALFTCDEPVIKKEPVAFYSSQIDDELIASGDEPIDYHLSEGTDIAPDPSFTGELDHFDVREILKQTDQGKKILKSLDNQDIAILKRRTMTKLLVEEVVRRFGLYPPTCAVELLAAAICEQFPFLSEFYGGREAWFSKKKVGGKQQYVGFLYQKLSFMRKKHNSMVKAQRKQESLLKLTSGSKHEKTKLECLTEMEKAQEEVADHLDEIWENLNRDYCQVNINPRQSTPTTKSNGIDSENKYSDTTYDDCVAIANDNDDDSIDERDGLTVVAYDDYCELKFQSDTLEEQLEKERELRKSAEEKLIQVEAEKLALEQEVNEYRSRRYYTRWKHNIVEYCRRDFQ